MERGDESTATRIAVYTDGCFTVGVAGEPWLVSAGVELHVPSGAWLTSTDGSLYNKNASAYHGRDEIGSYSAYTIHWATPKWPGRYPAHLNFTTTFTAYDNGQMLTFTQSFGGNTSLNATVPPTADAWGVPNSGFPTFDSTGRAKLGGPKGLGFVSYGEVGLPTVGRFPNGSCEGKSVHYKKGLSPFQWDGVPLVFLDEGSRTAAVLSPISGFFDSVCSYIEGAVSPREPVPPANTYAVASQARIHARLPTSRQRRRYTLLGRAAA